MSPPVTPAARRDQLNASRQSSQAGSSQPSEVETPTSSVNRVTDRFRSNRQVGNLQALKSPALSDLANMVHSNPVPNTVSDANGKLSQQPQNANQLSEGAPIMPSEHTPMSTPLRHPVSSPLTRLEQNTKTSLQSQTSKIFKTRVTIAISGPPASGKSTLAYLLAAVFEGATIQDTGFAGAQSMYPLFNGRIEENPKRRGPITKVVVIHQSSYVKPVADWPVARWSELCPYSPAMEVMNPQTGAARAFAEMRGRRAYERYWEAAYNSNIAVDPGQVSRLPSSDPPRLVLPSPIRVLKSGPNMDCRGAIQWTKFGKAINDGMTGHKNEKGMLETEEGRERVAAYLEQHCPNTRIPLVDSRKLEPLRERIRQWIREETAQNDRIGFPGRSVVGGSLRQVLILDGSLLFLRSHPVKGVGGENLMKACDVKLFLPTLEAEAIQRCFSQAQYMDPPTGTRKEKETWMFEGYFSEVAWKEYKSEHAWLFENGDSTNRFIKTIPETLSHGIHVRDFYDTNLQEKGHKYEGKKWADATLDWAVRTILSHLSVEEGFGRQAFFTKKMNEAMGRGKAAAEFPGQRGESNV